ncbi:hypothetical protein AB0J86_21605 [Micromonospora sp. NPDC049559]|uniref:hypothetical protein n=1 Tax=Micromonospora sp. NPDC049559 TaxID=3155923 RepID=UPI00344ADEA1
MAEALEVTTFRLADGRTGADFVAANEDINAYLKRQHGFRWRRITEHEDGTIVDVVAWESVSDAEASARGIMTEMGDSPVHGTIDQSTVDFRILSVLQHTT